MIRVCLSSLLCCLALMANAAPDIVESAGNTDSADTLAKLFTSTTERHQIDLERERVIAGEALEAGTPMRDPDIRFRAILYPPDSEPLLWINNTRATLAQWQQQLDLLVVQRLWLEGDLLSFTLDGERKSLKPNQVFNRHTGEITEAHKYIPVPLDAVSASRPGGAGSSTQTLIKQAKTLRQRTTQLPQ